MSLKKAKRKPPILKMVLFLIVALIGASQSATQIHMLPNSTNNAYHSGSSTAALCTSPSAATEFTTAQYGYVNVSDSNRYSQTAVGTGTSTERCTFYDFTFNLSKSGITVGSITSLNISHQGYYT